MESLESEFEQSQSDLRLAFKRISDLQAIIVSQTLLKSPYEILNALVTMFHELCYSKALLYYYFFILFYPIGKQVGVFRKRVRAESVRPASRLQAYLGLTGHHRGRGGYGQ